MGKNCETKYGVVEEIQNQNGVVVFSNLEDAIKVVLVKMGMNNIGYLLRTYVFLNYSSYLNGSCLINKKAILFDKILAYLLDQNLKLV